MALHRSTTITLLIYTLIGVLVAIAGGLAGWYAYIRANQTSVQRDATARGFNTTAPSFSGVGGSTGANISAGAAGTSTPYTDTTMGGFLGQVTNLLFGTSTTTDSATSSVAYETPRLWHIDKMPVAGFGFVPGEHGPRLYYVAQATGYVFSADPRSGTIARLSTTLRAKIYEASVDEYGTVVERSMDDNEHIITFVGGVSTSTATTSSTALLGSLLPKDIRVLSTDRAGSLAYLLTTATGSAVVVQARAGKPRVMTTLGIADWRFHLLRSGTLIMSQSPSDDLLGYAYRVEKNGTLAPLVSAPGLTLAHSDVEGVYLYGSAIPGTLTLYVHPEKGAASVKVPIATIADKCAWVPGKDPIAYCGVPSSIPLSRFLDGWYQGALHTDDTVWVVDPKTASAKRFYVPSANGGSVDIEEPLIDSTGTFMAFRNAADHSLWLLRIVQ